VIVFFMDMVKADAEAQKALADATDALKEREMAVEFSLADQLTGSAEHNHAVIVGAMLADEEIQRLTLEARRLRSARIDSHAELEGNILLLREREVVAHEQQMRMFEETKN
jgi:hypothetical protein